MTLLFFPFVLVIMLVGVPLCGRMGLKLAVRKGRPWPEGLLLGLLLRPVGLVIEDALSGLGRTK